MDTCAGRIKLRHIRLIRESVRMNGPSLSKLYATVGVALLGFSFNLFWLERTGASIFETIVPHKQTASAVLIGVFAIALVSLFELLLVERYWRDFKGEPWYERLPTAFVIPHNPRDPLAIAIRLAGFIAFVLVPAYIAARFLVYLWAQEVIDRQGEYAAFRFATPTWAFLSDGTFSGDNRFRIADRDGVAFFPTIEPVVLCVLVVAQCGWALVQSARLILDVRLSGRLKGASKHLD
jgi:hypothetical protein